MSTHLCRNNCGGEYIFIEIDEYGLEIWRCNVCGDEQIPETM